MARTHRKHISENQRAKFGGKDKDLIEKRVMKSHKQRRVNDRAAIRKEWSAQD